MTIRAQCQLIAVAFCVVAAGCGGGRSAQTQPPPSDSTEAAPNDEPAGDATAAGAPSPDKDGRTRWLGDIPYDAFYDRPLEVYREGGPAAEDGVAAVPAESRKEVEPVAAASSTPEPTTASPAGPPDSPPSDAAEEVPWDRVAPIDVLASETKEIRTRLAANLQTVATYNANTDMIETDGSVLALIAAIIERHPQTLSWSDRARYVRRWAYDIYVNASGRGRGPFQATKEPFEKIIAIWDGGPAPDDEVDGRIPLGEAGDRARMMQHIEQSFHWLRSDINTPAQLKAELDRVIRETTVLAALGTALADSSFDAAEEEPYRGLLQQFIEGQQTMTATGKADDFAGFEAARADVQKSCDACHLQYRTRSTDE